MTVKELKEQLKGMPEKWPVFMNSDPEIHPDLDEPCNTIFQDLDAKAVILRPGDG